MTITTYRKWQMTIITYRNDQMTIPAGNESSKPMTMGICIPPPYTKILATLTLMTSLMDIGAQWTQCNNIQLEWQNHGKATAKPRSHQRNGNHIQECQQPWMPPLAPMAWGKGTGHVRQQKGGTHVPWCLKPKKLREQSEVAQSAVFLRDMRMDACACVCVHICKTGT